MTEPTTPVSEPPTTEQVTETIAEAEEKPSYVKLAMRNMVKKKGKSLTHFFLSTAGMLALLVGLAYLTR